MIRNLFLVMFVMGAQLFSSAAHAWFFFFIPTGAIQKAMEVDPDSIVVSTADRSLGQCAGYHLNQAQRGMSRPVGRSLDGTGGGMIQQEIKQTPESKFHSDIADTILKKASDQNKVKQLGEAYSVRWSRVASAGDMQLNRQYGGNLAIGCRSNDMPLLFSEYPGWQARQEDVQRSRAEEERKRAEELDQQRRQREQELSRADAKIQSGASGGSSFDYVAEGKKSARILGCQTDDVKVIGAENNSVLVRAMCANGQALALICDSTGTCLKR